MYNYYGDNMSFEEYMNSKNINWKEELSIDQIERLNKLFLYKRSLEESNRRLLNKSFSNSGIDYSTDYNKNNEKLSIIYNEIESIFTSSNENIKTK